MRASAAKALAAEVEGDGDDMNSPVARDTTTRYLLKDLVKTAVTDSRQASQISRIVGSAISVCRYTVATSPIEKKQHMKHVSLV